MPLTSLDTTPEVTSRQRRQIKVSHIPTELATCLEKSLSDLADGAVLYYVHHDLKQVAALPSDLFEPRKSLLGFGCVGRLELLVTVNHHLPLALVRARDIDVEVIR